MIVRWRVQGTRVYRDPFGEHMLSSAFEQHNKLVQSLQAESLPRLEGPLWWMAADPQGSHVLHATLTDPGAAVALCLRPCSTPPAECRARRGQRSWQHYADRDGSDTSGSRNSKGWLQHSADQSLLVDAALRRSGGSDLQNALAILSNFGSPMCHAVEHLALVLARRSCVIRTIHPELLARPKGVVVHALVTRSSH